MKKRISQEDQKDFDAMAATKSGDISAFEHIVRRHQGSLINYFYRYTRDIEIAKELTQEVFLRVFKAAKRYKPKAKFTTYLFRVAHNLAINEVIAKKGPDIAPNTEDGPGINSIISGDDDEKTPEMVVINAESKEAIADALATLAPGEKSALIMKYAKGMSYAEIAEALDRSISAIDSLLSRARGKLKKLLEKEGTLIE